MKKNTWGIVRNENGQSTVVMVRKNKQLEFIERKDAEHTARMMTSTNGIEHVVVGLYPGLDDLECNCDVPNQVQCDLHGPRS